VGGEGDPEDPSREKVARGVPFREGAVDGPERERDEKARRNVVLQIMGIAHVEVGHRREEGRRSPRHGSEVLRDEPSHEHDGRESEGDAGEPSREVEVGGVLEEAHLEIGEALVPSHEPAGEEEPAHQREQVVEEEARIHVIAGVGVLSDRERAGHDVGLVRVVDEGKTVPETVEPEGGRQQENRDEPPAVSRFRHQLVDRCSMTRSRMRSRLTRGA
jgi:hypothetical protein